MLAPPPEELAPPPRGNPGSATGNSELFKCCPQMSGIKSLAHDNILT